MIHRVENGDKYSEKGDIMFGGSRDDRVLRIIAVRRNFPFVLERNVKIL